MLPVCLEGAAPCMRAVAVHQNMQGGANSSAEGLFGAGSELVLGPWSHGGLVDQSVAQDSSFNQPKHSMAFINRCCDHTPAAAPGPQQPQQAQQPLQSEQAQHAQHDPAVPSNTNGMTHMTEGQAGVVPAHAADPQTCGISHQSPSKEEEDAASPSVHFFMMGDEAHRGWKSCHSWPPPSASSPPLKLFLNKAPGPEAKAAKSWFRRNRMSAPVAGDEDAASQVRMSSSSFHTCSQFVIMHS